MTKVNLSADITTSSAANMLGLSTTMVQSLVDQNALQGWRTSGGHRRISMASIHQYQKQALGTKSIAQCLRRQPRVLVVCETTKTYEQLQQSSAKWGFFGEIKFLDSIAESLLCLGSSPPDLLIMEMALPKQQQLKTIQALTSFNTSSNPVSVVLITQDRIMKPSNASQTSNSIELVAGKLTDEWLRGYLTGVTCAWQFQHCAAAV